MNYVDHLNLFGVEAKEIPCIKGTGAPTETTIGAVGLFYMDTETGDVYKCTAATENVYTWEAMVESSDISLVTPQQYGAVGDGLIDDTAAIQAAIDSGKTVYFPEGKYLISETIVINNIAAKMLYAEESTIVYTGAGYAVRLCNLYNNKLLFGNIRASNGGCICFVNENDGDFSQYVSIYATELTAKTNCIYADVSTGWVNHVQIYNTRFNSGENAVHLVHRRSTNSINDWIVRDCGFEGVTNGVFSEAIDGVISQIQILNCRHAELVGKLLITQGRHMFSTIVLTSGLSPDDYEVSDSTNNVMIFGSIMSAADGIFISAKGIINRGCLVYEPIGAEGSIDYNNFYGTEGAVDLRIANKHLDSPTYIIVGPETTALYLSKCYGMRGGRNRFVLEFNQNANSDFTVYDYDDNAVFNNFSGMGWCNYEFEWRSEAGWSVNAFKTISQKVVTET